MRVPATIVEPFGKPQLLSDAEKLAEIYRTLDRETLTKLMGISPTKAAAVRQQLNSWNTAVNDQVPAIDAFVGDIYSGLQVQTWSEKDREYAHKHLLILSGLYGALRACDGIMPYRLEMGYKLPGGTSLYDYWSDKLTSVLPASTSMIVNLSAVEYTRALLPYVDRPTIAPKFMTVSPKSGEPTFVTVHAKIARGAFARWMIVHRIDEPRRLHEFSDLGYIYDAELSSESQPVFVADRFEGIGLSVRLTK